MTVADLSKIKQMPDETAEQYLSRFKRYRNRCQTNLPEWEFVNVAQNGRSMELSKKEIGRHGPSGTFL